MERGGKLEVNPMDYIKPELLILIPVLYFVGVAAKNSTLIKDNIIPLFLGIIGIFLSLIYVLATCDIGNAQSMTMGIFVAITQGILCSGTSVYVNQLIKQGSDKPK